MTIDQALDHKGFEIYVKHHTEFMQKFSKDLEQTRDITK